MPLVPSASCCGSQQLSRDLTSRLMWETVRQTELIMLITTPLWNSGAKSHATLQVTRRKPRCPDKMPPTVEFFFFYFFFQNFCKILFKIQNTNKLIIETRVKQLNEFNAVCCRSWKCGDWFWDRSFQCSFISVRITKMLMGGGWCSRAKREKKKISGPCWGAGKS